MRRTFLCESCDENGVTVGKAAKVGYIKLTFVFSRRPEGVDYIVNNDREAGQFCKNGAR